MLNCIQDNYGVENDGSRYTSESKLNKQGKWVKLKVDENAIYKLTYDDIQKLGVNPAKAKIFGYGGWILNEDFTQPYIDDLPEVACWKSGSGEELKSGEYLLFYGRGVVKWSYNSQTKEYIHENNPYSTHGTYFLTDAIEGNPQRMEVKASASSADVTLTTFEDYMIHEKEEFSIAKVGRELYGESFSGKNTQVFSFRIPGIITGNENGNSSHTGSSISLSFASAPENSTALTLSINNSADQFANFIETAVYPSNGTYTKATAVDRKAIWSGDKNENTKIQINHPNGVKLAYLNYIRLNMIRKLQYYNTGYTFFRSSQNLNNSIQYNIQNATSDLLVFDITANYDTKKVQTTFSNNTLSFNVESGAIREFVLVDPKQSFATPQKINEVASQNLHGLGQIDMAIISPTAFVSEAERLAQVHRDSKKKLKVQVVTPEQIYNEFSSGTPDASAYRRFMKMFYDRGTNETDRPKYLLLFGDGMFDNRFIDPTCKSFNKDQFLLVYQTKESSLTTDESCPSDDYFGFLDESDDNKSYGTRKLKLGIGRFTIQNTAQAKKTVDKTISYMNNTNYGIWKNSVVLLADDSDSDSPGSSFTLHMKQTDSIANSILRKHYPEYMVTKVYFDAFTPENSGGKKTFDNTAKPKLFKALNDGALVLNYTGHGGGVGLADNILTINDVPKMSFKNLPLWITATCDFAWFDGTTTNAGEEVFLHEKSGGIALFTTTRVVYSDENLKINYAIIKNLFAKNSDGSRPTLGDVLRESKNSIEANYKNNKLKYFLIGDPALTLNYPEYQIEIDQINDNLIDDNPVTLKALETVKVSGFVKNGASIASEFNGILNANVYDGLQTIQTVTVNTEGNHSYFTDYPSLISPSYCNVEGGKFEFTFSVMKDISDINSLGKMNLYAYDINSGTEANGSFMNYSINGVDETADQGDKSSPVIEYIYLNDSTFQPGNTVNETPYFVAKVADKLGINMSGAGTGHDIEIIIDNSRVLTYNLNGFYNASVTEKNTGIIAYSIPELAEGEHSLKFQVWNILNNVTIETFNFSVKKGLQPRISDLTANLNPARISTGTSFTFSHDRPETRIEVTINVHDLSGRRIWNHKESDTTNDYSYKIDWDLKGDDGSYVKPGVYIYSAVVKTENGTETTKSKKLIVLD